MSYKKHLMTRDEPPSELYKATELGTNLAEVGTDAISRQAAIESISKLFHPIGGSVLDEDDKKRYDEGADDALQEIEELPSAEPKRGKWISADAIFGGVPFYCSECGENTRDTVMGKPRWSFCPNCGCRMDGGEP